MPGAMAAGGGSGKQWIWMLVGGIAAIGAAKGLHHAGAGPGWLASALLAVGGMAVVLGSCESLIKCNEGVAAHLRWNTFVAGQIAGLASNIPEVVMLGFVVAKAPRVGFIVVAFTLHFGALLFGVYSGLLPRDERGRARLPEPMVKLSTDLYACAGAVFLATGAIMLAIDAFHPGPEAVLRASDLYVLGGALLFVEVVAVARLIGRFSGRAGEDADEPGAGETPAVDAEALPSVGSIVAYGLVGVAMSVVGGHAIGEFADTLVATLTGAGYSQMFGALVLAVFAAAGQIAMVATSHAKGKHDLALANVSAGITQVPFVVMPIVLIQIAAFGQLGIIPTLGDGGVLPIDLETTSVFLLAFPPLLILWKAVEDDGTVNWVETATMVAVFGLTLYFLVQRA